MVRRKLTLPACFLFALFILGANSTTRAQTIVPQPPEIYPYVPPDTKDGLHVFAKLDKDSLKLTEAFTITVGFKNVGTSPLIIYKNMGWGALASLFLTTIDQNGIPLNPGFISETRDRPPFFKQDFITLQPGETFTIKSFSSPESLGVQKAGDYKISISYESPVQKEYVPRELNVWTQEKGILYTKDIPLKVIK